MEFLNKWNSPKGLASTKMSLQRNYGAFARLTP
jgi:hypothetical protein